MKSLFIFLAILLFSLNSIFSQTDKEEYKKAVTYFNQANEYKQKFDFENAEQYFNKAAVIFNQYNYIGNYIQCKYSVADIYIQKSEKNEAKTIIDEIEKLSIEKYGKDNKFLVNILYAKGAIFAIEGKHNVALSYYKQSSKLNDKYDKPDSFFKSNLYTNIGNSYSELGKLDLALDNYRKDLNIKKKYVDDNHPMLAVVYNNIATIYQAKGLFNSALLYINKALDINKKAYGENHSYTAVFYNSKGNVYSEMGQYDLALEYLRISLKINKFLFGKENIKVAKNLNDIGVVLNKQQKYNEALIYFKDAYDIQVDILGENNSDIAGTCNNIGFILEKQGKPETSLKYFEKAIAIKTKNFGENHPELATYYNNIGINYNNQNNYDKALENYLKSISILENNYGSKFPGNIRMYLNTAELYRKKNNFKQSLKYFQKSISANIINFNPDSTDYFSNPYIKNYLNINGLLFALHGKAGALESIFKQSKDKKYLEYSKDIFMLCDSVISIARKQAKNESDKIELGNNSKKIYQEAVTVLSNLADNEKKEKNKKDYYKEMFYFSEKNKALVLSQSVISAKAKSFGDIPDSILNIGKTLKEQVAEIEKSIIESSNEKEIEKFRAIKFILNENLRKYNSDLALKYPKYYNSKYKDIELDIKDIQSNLSKEQAVRSYFSGDDVIIIFTITKDDIKVYSIDKPKDFETKVKDFNRFITSGYKSYFSMYLESANDFYNLFFPNKLPEEITKLTIITDGLIGIIPFEALITEKYTGDVMDFKSYPFLIKKYQINYFYSAGLLLKSYTAKRHRDNRKSWLGVAPVFNDISKLKVNNVALSPLPGSEKEIQDIYKLFFDKDKEASFITNRNATESFIKNEDLKNYKYIHIATHGTVNTDEPKLSAIIMYPEENNNDGVLYSGEIYNLKLDADLTVLSACETGLGKISKSEGIIGLSRALIYAGSENTIVSLWKVSDASTHDLMVDFYTNLLVNEKDRANALHKAKLNLINKSERFAHPFFWSPFVLIGK